MMETSDIPQQILIVDDDPILQAFLGDYLSQQGYQTRFTKQGESIEALLTQSPTDLIILDILLPGKDGFHWLAWLQQHYPTIKVIMLSVKNHDDDRVLGLESGALDYLAKPFNPRELLARINNLLQPPVRKNNICTFGEFSFDLNNPYLTKNNQDIKLTRTELLLLTYFCSHPDQLVTRDDLSQALRGDTHHPLDRSIDVHINRLRGKIEINPSSPKFIRTVWGKGYQFHLHLS